ncbi:hypothetical protein [Streptomyces sp. NPDC005573]|uniref:hypothetical protein n=1 Tax=Streptomyces sp. NPDC005573 TaxID=3156890 RepID=UPI0033B19994
MLPEPAGDTGAEAESDHSGTGVPVGDDFSAEVPLPDNDVFNEGLIAANLFGQPYEGGESWGGLPGSGGPQEPGPTLPTRDPEPSEFSEFAWPGDPVQPHRLTREVTWTAPMNHTGLEPRDDTPEHRPLDVDAPSGSRGGSFIEPAAVPGPDAGERESIFDLFGLLDDPDDPAFLAGLGALDDTEAEGRRGEGGRQDLPLEADLALREESAPGRETAICEAESLSFFSVATDRVTGAVWGRGAQRTGLPCR